MVKILIVEDDNDINNMIHDLLRLNCIESVSAYSGTEALLLLDEHVDLVLLDLMLPGLSGQEVIKEIKKKKDLPVIILTAIDKMDTKLDLFTLGADDYLIKPFDNNELLARVKIQLKHRQVAFSSALITYKDIILDENSYKVTCNEIKINLSKEELSVENTGVSIPKNQINEIFNAFYRVDKSRNRKTGGTGLGLYIVKTILDKHENIDYTIESGENSVIFKMKFIYKE